MADQHALVLTHVCCVQQLLAQTEVAEGLVLDKVSTAIGKTLNICPPLSIVRCSS
jgi:hypothetical protein